MFRLQTNFKNHFSSFCTSDWKQMFLLYHLFTKKGEKYMTKLSFFSRLQGTCSRHPKGQIPCIGDIRFNRWLREYTGSTQRTHDTGDFLWIKRDQRKSSYSNCLTPSASYTLVNPFFRRIFAAFPLLFPVLQ